MTDLDTIRDIINSPANDGECEHGFWHSECTNRKCWERDTRVVLHALDDPYWAKVLSENEHLRADADRLAAALEDAEAELDHRPTSGGSEGVFCAVHLDWPWVVRDGVARCALAWNISDALRQHVEP